LSAQNLAATPINVDGTHSAWKFLVGYRSTTYFAVEGAYAYLGRFTFDALTTSDPGSVSGNTRVEDWSVSALGVLPLTERFDAFAKAGLGLWQAKLSASGLGAGSEVVGQTAHGIHPVFGVGARWYVMPRLAVRGEWEFYSRVGESNKTGRTDIGVWSVGIQYAF
jgi:OOP family OmpA-OmpF porin